jgi:hypothetical protein
VSTLKVGEVHSLKVTGEYIYLTGKQYDNGKWEVHRPKLTRDGIDHVYDAFEAGEIETVEEHIEREVRDAFLKLDAQKKVMDAKMQALQTQPDEPETKIDFNVN